MTAFDVTFMSVASALGIGLIAPQTWSILRTHNAAGVSVTGLVCSCISYAGWICFALYLFDIAMLVSLLLPFALEATTLALAIRWGGQIRGLWVAAIWLAMLASAALLGWSALGALLAVSIVTGYGPAVVEAWLAADVSGVSAIAWRVRVIDGLVWASYGLVTTQTESLIYGSTAASLAVGVIVGVQRHRRVTVDIHGDATSTVWNGASHLHPTPRRLTPSR